MDPDILTMCVSENITHIHISNEVRARFTRMFIATYFFDNHTYYSQYAVSKLMAHTYLQQLGKMIFKFSTFLAIFFWLKCSTLCFHETNRSLEIESISIYLIYADSWFCSGVSPILMRSPIRLRVKLTVFR